MNKVIVSCAGSGKTTHIVNRAMQLSENNKVLITTYTDANTEEIIKKFYEIFGYKPSNVDILPWFTFQLKHLIRPYQLPFIDEQIKNINMVSGISNTFKGKNDKGYYIKDGYIYSDKIALLAYKTLSETQYTFSRLSKIYDYIFIDEFQDLEGYDLDIVKYLASKNMNIEIVCDPRQHTFSTHYDKKNHKYTCTPLKFIEDKCKDLFMIDVTTLNDSYRCPQSTIRYASTIFPDLPQSNSLKEYENGDGVVFVKESLVNEFLSNNPNVIQLRNSCSTKVNSNYDVITFGKAKGLSWDNVLIYSTVPMRKSILENDFTEYKSKSDFYVALTRARHKTGIIVPDKDYGKYDIIKKYIDSFLNEKEEMSS